MALMSSCLCCSLLTAAIMAGILSVILYGVAFSLELWWILKEPVAMSAAAYVLAAAYLFMVFLSLMLLLGLRTKRTVLLLVWMLLNVLYIFPEAGLVLFMSIYHWNGKTYGIVELSIWAVRVVVNVFGIVSVQSLWSYWRDEKSIFRSLQELGNTTGEIVSTGVGDNSLGIPGQLKLKGSLRYTGGVFSSDTGEFLSPASFQRSLGYSNTPLGYSNTPLGYSNTPLGYSNTPLGYSNPAFATSAAHVTGSLAVTKYNNKDSLQRRRSSSAGSGFVSASRLSSIKPSPHILTQVYGAQELSSGNFSYSRSLSRFDLPSFGLDPDSPIFIQAGGYGPGGLPVNIYRGNSREDQLHSEQMEWYRPRSLGNLTVDLDTISIWSGQLYARSFDANQSGLTRKHRTASLGNLNIGYSRDWREPRGSRQSLGQISGVSDNPSRYGDIAL